MLRVATFAFALIIMGGEVLRSWGERPVIFWIDDFMVGIALIVGAIVVWIAGRIKERYFV